MVALNDDLGAAEPRARVGGAFALLHVSRLKTAKLDKQTQQRGDNLFLREN